MRAAAEPAQIDDHGDQQPYKIDSRRGHAVVQFPRVNQRGERQENKAEYGQQKAIVERALQVGGKEPQQREHHPRKQKDDEKEEARHRSISSAAIIADLSS